MLQSAEKSLQDLYALLGPKGRQPASSVFKLLRDDASFEMNVNGSSSSVTFQWVNPLDAGRPAYLHRLLLGAFGGAVEDHAGFFTRAVLANGLLITVRDQDGAIQQDFDTTEAPIKRHVEFGTLAGVDVASDSTAGTSRFNIRWTFSHGASRPLLISPGWSINVEVRDDLTALAMLRMSVQGYYE